MNGILESFSTVAAILVFIGGAFVFLRGSLYKGAITALESTVSAQGKEIDSLKGKVERGEIEGARKDARITALERENNSLIQVRPSAEAIQELSNKLDSHHNETMEVFRDYLRQDRR